MVLPAILIVEERQPQNPRTSLCSLDLGSIFDACCATESSIPSRSLASTHRQGLARVSCGISDLSWPPPGIWRRDALTQAENVFPEEGSRVILGSLTKDHTRSRSVDLCENVLACVRARGRRDKREGAEHRRPMD